MPSLSYNVRQLNGLDLEFRNIIIYKYNHVVVQIYLKSMQMVEHSIKDHLYASRRCHRIFCFYFVVLVHNFIGMLKVDYLSSIVCLMCVLRMS